MAINPFPSNGKNVYGTPGGYDEKRPLKIAIIVFAALIAISVIILVVYLLLPPSQQSKYTDSATAAARKNTPDAKVTNVKVSGGYASAIVTDPNTDTQGSAGNTTIFKVNKDGSMTQIAAGSSFSPIDLINLGIPLTDQAKLNGSTLDQAKQALADTCGYMGNNTPGYSGFDGSFDPDGWQVDSSTLENLEQSLTSVISAQNVQARAGKNVICVNATRTGSSATTDNQTYISTFGLQIQFITSDGTLSTHQLTFAVGPQYYHQYTLDGQVIQSPDA